MSAYTTKKPYFLNFCSSVPKQQKLNNVLVKQQIAYCQLIGDYDTVDDDDSDDKNFKFFAEDEVKVDRSKKIRNFLERG